MREFGDNLSMAGPAPDSGRVMRAALERRIEGPKEEEGRRAPPLVPDHSLLRRIGTGAYGEVWLARSALGTLRAVKVVYRDRFEDERPFLREFNGILKYEPVSRSHEGLVAVLHVGRNDQAGCFYYVMELADPARGKAGVEAGSAAVPEEAADAYSPRTLGTELAERRRLPPGEAAQLVLRLAGALAHLHAHGLVHRDVKPSNVIFVEGKPKLADIGLVTGAGDSRSFVGTEGFIPPEGPGTAQADLYGLGKLLYELVTGRDRLDFPQLPPEFADSPDEQAVLELNEVITRACAPQPNQRYTAATEFAADLNWFLASRSLRQARKSERHLAWLRRFAYAGAIVLALAAGAVWFARSEARAAQERERISRERAREETTLRRRAEAAEEEQSRLREEAQAARANEAALRRLAEGQELAARKKAYASDMNLLEEALASDNLARAQELLDRQRPEPGQQDLRGWEWRYFWQFCQSDAAFTLSRRSTSIVSVSFSRDGALLAAGAWNGEVTVWDVAERHLVFRNKASPDGPSRLAFAPDRDLLAFYDRSGDQRSIVLWDSSRRSVIRRFPLDGALRNLAFTRDGRLFSVDLSASNNLITWAVGSGAVLSRATATVADYGMGTVFNIAADGSKWAYAISGRSHSVREIQRGGEAASDFRVADELVTALAFSPDARALFTGGGYAEGDVKEWDLDTHQLLGSFTGHRSWVGCLSVLPDGSTLASASADRTIRLWDLQTRQLLRTLRGHNGEIWTLDVSPDGHWLAAGSKDGSVVLWDLNSSTNRPPAFRTLSPERTRAWSYSPDGRWCGVIDGQRLDFYDARTLHLAGELGPALTNVHSFAFSPDQRLLATTDANGNLTAWRLPSMSLLTNFPAHSTPHRGAGVVFLRGGKSLVTTGADDVIKEWDAATWGETGSWRMPSDRVAIALNREARLAAVASRDGTVELIELSRPERRRRFELQGRLSGLALSPDGATLAASSENGTVELWNTKTLARTGLLRGVLLGYHSVTISADGERLAGGSNGQEAIKLWDLDSREEVATLPGRGSFFSLVKFSPDGNTLSASNWNGVIHFWTAPSWRQIEPDR
ncbi:MAG: protein kinase domain-containing protein [Limisphaerales bacterium]